MESLGPGELFPLDFVKLDLQVVGDLSQLWVTNLVHPISQMALLVKATNYPIEVIWAPIKIGVHFEEAEKTFQFWLLLVHNPAAQQTIFAELRQDEPDEVYLKGVLEQLPVTFSDVSVNRRLTSLEQIAREIENFAVTLYSNAQTGNGCNPST